MSPRHLPFSVCSLCYSCVQIYCSFYTSNIWGENIPWNKLLEPSLRVLFLRSISRVLPARTLEPSRRCALLTIRSFILLLTILSFKGFPYLGSSPPIRSTAGTLSGKSQANTKWERMVFLARMKTRGKADMKRQPSGLVPRSQRAETSFIKPTRVLRKVNWSERNPEEFSTQFERLFWLNQDEKTKESAPKLKRN